MGDGVGMVQGGLAGEVKWADGVGGGGAGGIGGGG